MYRLLIALLFILFHCSIYAKSDLPVPLYKMVENISKERYSGNSKIWDIAEGDQEKIYFAAGKYLCVWSGLRWSSYEMQATIRSLYYDKDEKRLYCAGDNFFGYWLEDSVGDYEFYSLYRNDDMLNSQIFWRIFKCRDKLYIQTHESLLDYDLKDNHVHDHKINKTIGYIFKDNDNIYIQCESDLYRVSDNSLVKTGLTSQDRIVALKSLDSGFCAVSEERGIWLTNGSKVIELNTALNKQLSKARIFSAQCRDDGTFIIGTVMDGAYEIGKEGEIISHFNEMSGLKYTTVLSLLTTSNGDTWLGLDGGLAYAQYNPPEMFYHSYPYNIGDVYSSILWNETLYVGTNKGLYKIDRYGVPQLINGFQGQIWSIKQCGEDLAVVHDRGLCLISRDGSSKLIMPGVWKFNEWRHKKGLYYASDKHGLHIFEEKNGKIHFRNHITNSIQYNNISVKDDKYGNLWADELLGGVQRIIVDKNMQTAVKSRMYRVGNSNEIVRSVIIDNDIVFIQNDQCYTYDNNLDSIRYSSYYTTLVYPFLKNDVKLFQVGNRFFFYDGTQINMIERGVEIYVYYPHLFHGLPTNYFSPEYKNFTLLNDRYVAIGCSNGVALYDIHMRQSQKPLTISLRRCRYNLYGEVRSTNINENNDLIIPYGATNLKFEFWGVSKQNLVECYLDGDTVLTTFPQQSSFISIGHIPSGKHTLSILDVNNKLSLEEKITLVMTGEEDENKPYIINIIAERHWLLYWYSLLPLAVLLILLLAGFRAIYRWRIGIINRKYRQKQRELIDKEKIKYENQLLSIELLERNKKLSSIAMNDIHINNILKDIEAEVAKVCSDQKIANGAKDLALTLKPIKQKVEQYKRENGSWRVFESYFNGIYDGFLDRLRVQYPNLTNNDLKICAYIRLGMTTKEIANLVNIEVSSVETARYRLRKNMGLQASDSLSSILANI